MRDFFQKIFQNKNQKQKWHIGKKRKGLATTYSHAAVHGTTIGSKRLNERVRNENVCFPRAYDHQAKYSIFEQPL